MTSQKKNLNTDINEFKNSISANQSNINNLSKEYEINKSKLEKLIKSHSHKKSNSKEKIPKNLEEKYNKFNSLCQQCLNLANESYFMVDNEIKKTNKQIEKLKFEIDSSDANAFSFLNYSMNKQFDEIYNTQKFGVGKRNRTKSKSGNLKIKKLKTGKIYKKKFSGNLENSEKIGEDSGWEDVTYQELDGKIGPKETTYCFCNYISYGNMIKCDNSNCEKKWFHFHCVGLKNQPKGKWFCSEQCAKEFHKKYNRDNNINKKEKEINKNYKRKKK